MRQRYADVLQLQLVELDALVSEARATPERPPLSTSHGLSSGDVDEVIRREFLRALAVASAAAALPADESSELAEGVQRQDAADFAQMNGHLWQVYQLARAKGSVYPVVRDQLQALSDSLAHRSGAEANALCEAAADLFQLAGEVAFDANRYTEAAASYTLAAAASKDARSFDLWSCALVRHAYIDLHERRYRDAAATLSAAERIAKQGDSSLSTRHWVASVQAEAYAGLGMLDACERALDEAERVQRLSSPAHNGGWLRFDGSRLAEERGARYVQLGRLDLAEKALQRALAQKALAQGKSFRRRGAVLTDLAAIGAKRRDPDQVIAYGTEAVQLARESSSGYIARRLLTLRDHFGPLARNDRIAELGAEIAALRGA
ncbi:hypothetical protein GCM10020000_76060 [Streptomyces olivoverticillatus]